MIVRNKIYSSRSFLQSLNEEHATEEYCGWLNDSVVNQYLSTRNATVSELQLYIRSKNESTDALLLGIFCQNTGQHIGNVKLEPIDAHSATFGILIGNQNYWNKGFGLEVTERVVQYAFHQLGVSVVRLGVLKNHHRALKIYKSVGFKEVHNIDNSVVMEIERPKFRTVAIVQARMQSTRFPGKSLKKINNDTCLSLLIKRLQYSRFLDDIIVATGINCYDNAIEEECKKIGVKCFRGHDSKLLDRYYKCAINYDIDNIVRITADCPFTDWRLVDDVIDSYIQNDADYVSNVHPAFFPDGFDVEVFSFEALQKAWNQAKSHMEREHVTPYIWMHRGLFKCKNLDHPEDYSALRFTVDYPEDFELITQMCSHLNVYECGFQDVIDLYLQKFCGDHVENFTRNSSFNLQQQNNPTGSLSDIWLNRAKKIIPSASQTYSKSYKHFANPVVVEQAEGSRVWDVDGNEYVDYICGLGSVILGHNYPSVSASVKAQIDIGHCFPQVSINEIKLAETMISILNWPEQIRFMKNGSDATSAAIRISRAYTHRDYIACASYHGFHDWYIGSTPNSRGVPSSYKKLTKSFEYGNIEELKNMISQYDFAAIILEPITSDGVNVDFLKHLAELCRAEGILLIFDEVLTGFRSHRFAAHLEIDVKPDLATFGKSMANGYPISALVGKHEHMKLIDEDVFISMTFGGDSISITAALETIKTLQDGQVFLNIATKSNEWRVAIDEYIRHNKMSASVKTVGFLGHCGVSFCPTNVLTSLDLLSVYQKTLAQQGILTLGVNNFCHTHSSKDISNFIDATKVALQCIEICINKQSIKDYVEQSISPVFKR